MTLAQATEYGPTSDPRRSAWKSSQTLSNPLAAGSSTAWADARHLENVEFTVKNESDQSVDFYVDGSYDADGTDVFALGNGAKLTLGAGNVTPTKGVLSLAAFPGWVRVRAVAASNATGDATVKMLAHGRGGA